MALQLQALKATVADLFEMDPSEIRADTSFSDRGSYDSLKVVLLMAALEEDFGLNVPPDRAGEICCLQDILDYAGEQGVEVES